MRSIGERLDLRDNALNAIRLLLAVLVIVSHSMPIGAFGPEPALGDALLGIIAVGGFFTISGYLITRSRFGTPLLPYLWRRVLRIVPGYWASVIFTAFIAAFVLGLANGGWNFPVATHFFATNATLLLGGDGVVGHTLAGAPFPEAINGSWWTLRYEVGCYVLAGIAFFIPIIRKQRWPFVVAFVAATILSLFVHSHAIGGMTEHIALLLPFFAAGALVFRYADKIPLNGAGAALSAALIICTCISGFGRTLAALPLTYLLIWLAVVSPLAIRRFGSRNDISYGMYLYAFPVQQVLVALGAAKWGPFVFIILSIVITVPIAAFSWLVVERPAQRLKGQRPSITSGDSRYAKTVA